MQENYWCPIDRARVMHVEDETFAGEAGDALGAHRTPFNATLDIAGSR